MPKIINQTTEESALYRETLKLVKRANQRLLRMERATGEKGTFAAKQLYDYLDNENIKGITKGGRISLKKSHTPNQIKVIQKATRDYLKQETSTVRGAKKYTKKLNKKSPKPLSMSQASDIFQVRYNYYWIFEYMTPSEFYILVNTAKEENWSREKFIDELGKYITEVPDADMKEKIGQIYDYFMEE